MYIARNPHPIGDKRRLDGAHQACDYNRLHSLYHRPIRDFSETFGYYDISLFDLKGDLVYSVSKEARQLEMMGQEERPADLEKAAGKLQRETERLQEALHRFLSKGPK
jgi:methyl-accepting chemotaxis protein